MNKIDVLNGITVVDISQNLPGPYCSYLLQNMGASVIKIESENKPDPAIHLPTFYEKLNGEKNILKLNLKTDSGLNSFYEIVRKADVVIEGARPGVAKKLKVDIGTLSKYKPDLIYCSISGYGQNSPMNRTPAHDINLQGDSGLLNFFKTPKESICTIPIADLTASHNACSAILSSLYSKVARKGNSIEPTFIDISMGQALEEMVDIWKSTIPTKEQVDSDLDKLGLTKKFRNLNPIRAWLSKKALREPLSSLPHYDVFKCKNNEWIALGIVDEQHFWKELCDEFGGIFLKLRALKFQQRIIYGPIIKILIRRRIAHKTRRYWLTKLSNIPISSL